MQRVHTKIKIQDFLILFFLFGMIVFENGKTISKIYKLVFAGLTVLYLGTSGIPKIRLYHTWWIFTVLLLDCLSYNWAFSIETAVQGIKTVALNTFCIALLSLVIWKSKKWKEDIFKGVIFFPLLRFLGVLFEYGFTVFYGLRNITGFRDYNTIAMFAAIGAVFAFYQYRYIRNRNLFMIFGIINLIIVGLSLSRKGVLFLAIPIIILFISESKYMAKTLKNMMITLSVLALMCVIIMSVPALYDMIGKGIEDIVKYIVTGSGDASAAGRNVRILFGLRMIEERPWLGYGIQNYNYFFAISGYITNNMVVADNNYIDVLFNTGIIGLMLYYSIYVISVIKYVRNKNKTILNKLGFSILITLAICDYGVSAYLYMHSQFFLAISTMLILFKSKESESISFMEISQKNENNQLMRVIC